MSIYPREYKVSIDNGDVYWRNGGGLLHREEGPAYEFANGDVEYWLNGKLHRVGGPAIVRVDGHEEWYRYGLLHNENGPAIRSAGASSVWCDVEYWLEGMEYEMKEWEEEMKRRRGLGTLPASIEKAAKQYECMECGAVYSEQEPLCTEHRQGTAMETKPEVLTILCAGCKEPYSQNDLHEYQYGGFRVALYCLKCWPFPHQSKNPNPPKHPFCGACGLATAYLYEPNPCKSCGIANTETVECHICHRLLDKSNVCLHDGYYWCNECYRQKPHCLGYMCRNGEAACRCPCIRCCHACGVDCGAAWCLSCVKLRSPAPKRPHCLNYACLKNHECECPCSVCAADKELIASITDNRPEHLPYKCYGCTKMVGLSTSFCDECLDKMRTDYVAKKMFCDHGFNHSLCIECDGYRKSLMADIGSALRASFLNKAKDLGPLPVSMLATSSTIRARDTSFVETMHCWGCNKVYATSEMTFPEVWKGEYAYCQKCIEELGDCWEMVLTGGTGVPMKPVPYYNGGPCNYCGHKEPVACKSCGMFSCEKKDNCKDKEERSIHPLHCDPNVCPQCEKERVEARPPVVDPTAPFGGKLPICIYCDRPISDVVVYTPGGCVCQKCHRGMTLASVS